MSTDEGGDPTSESQGPPPSASTPQAQPPGPQPFFDPNYPGAPGPTQVPTQGPGWQGPPGWVQAPYQGAPFPPGAYPGGPFPGAPYPGSPYPGAPYSMHFPGQYPAPRSTDGFSIAALVCGILGLFLAIPLPLAVIFGFVGLSHTSGGRLGGRGLAIAGLILGFLGILLWVLFIVSLNNTSFIGNGNYT